MKINGITIPNFNNNQELLKEILESYSDTEDFFPLFYILNKISSCIEFSSLDEDQTTKFLGIISYFKLIWLDKKNYDMNDFLKVFNHILDIFKTNPLNADKIISLLTTSPRKFLNLGLNQEMYTDWEAALA